MPTWLKVVLGILGAMLLLCLASAGAGAWWFNANKETLKADGDEAKRAGLAFGSTTDGEGCLTEGLRRLDQDHSIVKQALNNIFVETCLSTAQRPPEFCKGVPAHGEVMATAQWSVTQCQQRQHGGDDACPRMMQVVQKVCAP